MKKFKYILAVPLIALGFCLAGCSADNTDVRTNTGVVVMVTTMVATMVLQAVEIALAFFA